MTALRRFFDTSYGLPALFGLLLGLSWPASSANLSFLAWFAFVPQFIFLERNRQNFRKSLLASYLAMFLSTLIAAGWLFNFPRSMFEIAVMIGLEAIWIFAPFLPFLLLQRRIGFRKALWALPGLWMVWEWTYLQLEFTMGTHLIAYSQGANLWLIQFADLTGVWGVSGWLVGVNVAFFHFLRSWQEAGHASALRLIPRMLLPFFLLPMLYAGWAFLHYADDPKAPAIEVALIPTQYGAAFMDEPGNHATMVEEVLHHTDSLAFFRKRQGRRADLYLWPETSMAFELDTSNLKHLLQEAVTDWQGALLAGGKGRDARTGQSYVAGILLQPGQAAPSFHYKTVLTPGQEAVPYHHALARLPFFPIPENDPRFHKKGLESKPLWVEVGGKNAFQLGVSLCFEQWYPDHWTELARNGAQGYAHLAGEGWYGPVGFQHFMAHVTRFRCIENRKAAARCANVGRSLFIDRLGRYSRQALSPAVGQLRGYSGTTPYAAHPNASIFIALLGIIFYLGSTFFIKQITSS